MVTLKRPVVVNNDYINPCNHTRQTFDSLVVKPFTIMCSIVTSMDFSRPLLVSVYLIATVMSVADSIQRSEYYRSTLLEAYPGTVLKSHVIAEYHVTCDLACGARCLAHGDCLSYNYQPISNWERRMPNCQLNDANRITSPEDYVVEPGAIYYEVFEERSGHGFMDVTPASYDLTFPNKGLTSYVSLTWPTNPDAQVNRFTLSFWMKTSDQDNGAPFSYAVPGAVNELTVDKDYIYIHDVSRSTSLGNYYDGIWHHVCFKWSNDNGFWRVVVDGAIINSCTSFQKGYVIQTGGILLVGQEQDYAPGDPNGFSSSKSFMGSISDMNLWNHIIYQDEVVRMSQTCDSQIGNVLKWSDFQISLHGDVIVESPSSCKVPV